MHIVYEQIDKCHFLMTVPVLAIPPGHISEKAECYRLSKGIKLEKIIKSLTNAHSFSQGNKSI